jgi:hypothetical protein
MQILDTILAWLALLCDWVIAHPFRAIWRHLNALLLFNPTGITNFLFQLLGWSALGPIGGLCKYFLPASLFEDSSTRPDHNALVHMADTP